MDVNDALLMLDAAVSAVCVSLAFHIIVKTDKDTIGQVDEVWLRYLRKIAFLTLGASLIVSTMSLSWVIRSIVPKLAGGFVLAVNELAIRRRATLAKIKENQQ